MADLKISQLNALAGSNLATADLVAVVDSSASETKKLTITDLITNGVSIIADDAIPEQKYYLKLVVLERQILQMQR